MMVHKKKVYFFQLNFIFSETLAYGYKNIIINKELDNVCHNIQPLCIYKAQSYKIWDKIFQLLHVFTSFNLQYNPFVHNGNLDNYDPSF